MRSVGLIIIAVIWLVDLLSMRTINLFLDNPPDYVTSLVSIIHWGILAVTMGFFLVFMISPPDMKNPSGARRVFRFTGFFILMYIPKLIFVLFNVLDELIFRTALFMKYQGDYLLIFSRAGAIAGISAFLIILYGILFGRKNLKVRRLSISSKSLPEEFDGFTIAQFSDFHLGSFSPGSSYPETVINRLNSLKADLIVFTGDLVNNVSAEAKPWVNTLAKLKAPHGKYSILGNHDYGEYVDWNSEEEYRKDHQDIQNIHGLAGFKLLNNEAVHIRKNGAAVGLLGVENWGLPPFSQAGDIKKAMQGAKDLPYHILLSHDPTHWDEQIKQKTGIGLTLSGHTHGFQFGIHTKKFKWSPVQYKYPKWIGHYKHNNQHLYVSGGAGFILFPGRAGIPPEITLITLRRE